MCDISRLQQLMTLSSQKKIQMFTDQLTKEDLSSVSTMQFLEIFFASLLSCDTTSGCENAVQELWLLPPEREFLGKMLQMQRSAASLEEFVSQSLKTWYKIPKLNICHQGPAFRKSLEITQRLVRSQIERKKKPE
jgi:hypothetical protein